MSGTASPKSPIVEEAHSDRLEEWKKWAATQNYKLPSEIIPEMSKGETSADYGWPDNLLGVTTCVNLHKHQHTKVSLIIHDAMVMEDPQ